MDDNRQDVLSDESPEDSSAARDAGGHQATAAQSGGIAPGQGTDSGTSGAATGSQGSPSSRPSQPVRGQDPKDLPDPSESNPDPDSDSEAPDE